MKKLTTFAFVSLLITILASSAFGQTTVFNDDFSTNKNATYTTSGAIGSSNWSVSRSGDDWGARRNTSPAQLELTNDVSGTTNVNGWVFTSVPTTGFSAPYNSTLNSNPGLVTWTFNLSTNRTSAMAGFSASNSYGMAVVLASSSTDIRSTGNGYAVVVGGGANNQIALVHFTSGFDGTIISLIGFLGAPSSFTNYRSVKVTFDPSTKTWELFHRDDGASSFADPETGSLTSLGTTIDQTHTGVSLAYFGAYWQGSTSGNQFTYYDNVKVTVLNASSPAIYGSPASLSNFSYYSGSGPSLSQSYFLSGVNLTPASGNLVVTAPTNYEVSSNNLTFSPSLNIAYTTGSLNATNIYVRLKSGLAGGAYNNENVVNSGGGATSVNVVCNGNVYKSAPTNHATLFTSVAGTPAHSDINLTWSDASSGVLPDNYLIKGSDISYAAITDPVDGVAETDGVLIKNIAQGTQTVSFSSLTANTQYYFKIFPYTNSGANTRYKTDGTVPQVERTTSALPAGLLLQEEFSFTGQLTSNSWTAHNGSGSNPISTASGLNYTGYISSGIGNAALIGNAGGEDINRGFGELNSNGDVVYLSFLVNVNEALSSKTGDYFIHLGDRVSGGEFALFSARVFARVVSDNVNFGLSNTSTPTYGTTNFAKNTTYLLIVKYVINTSGNDEVKLWVVSSGVPGSEVLAGSPEVTNTSTSGTDVIDAVGIRQGSATNSASVIVDGIRIGTAWSESPLPVELSSFTSSVSGQSVTLSWSTATEVDNYGFEVQKSENQSDWSTIGFVHGSGNSNSNKQYAYTDQQAGVGTIYYRLKQIDNAGTFKVYDPIAVEVEIPKDFTLSQNYPNPFNPATTINYTLPTAGSVTLQVYSMNGELVHTLVQGYQAAGSYSVAFDASRLASGTYAYRLITTGADGQTQSALKKMLLMK